MYGLNANVKPTNNKCIAQLILSYAEMYFLNITMLHGHCPNFMELPMCTLNLYICMSTF